MNSGLQSIVVLACLIAGFAALYYARGLTRTDYTGDGNATRKTMSIILYVIGVILLLLALICLAAVFAQLIGM
ncbi:hypothetical protein [Bifidobacterium crudilactis]|nr:hypothetical protein [Bifidobacterium crudilactis]MDN6016764.1 hypothetical protein [Bifidobacterium mongoliense]MDN6209201.1 hypothetical protein [Bifidobacterium crudilactis]MDN6467693.1 hypothetical protein [Bifidobacterium crudilactis]MDN6558700.1 hypothetical protein [Bifidobacterium crudilactis]MDN6622886.1 hypothetical protein [Bifidobacterium crudilactis]